MGTGSLSKPLLLTGSPRITWHTSVMMVEAGKAAGDRFHPWAAQGPGDQGCLGHIPCSGPPVPVSSRWPCGDRHRFCPGTLQSLFLPLAVNFQPLLWLINKLGALPAAGQELSWLHGSERKHRGDADAPCRCGRDAGAGSPLPTPGHPAARVPSAGRLRVPEHGAGQKYASGDNAGPASCHVHLWPALRLPAASSSCLQRQE